ncbi:MAG: hypothetical protein PHR77_01235 [Kiritimatiellae bacterium]|nr:hypothetical protein [Kiritimatiellia bacterium]
MRKFGIIIATICLTFMGLVDDINAEETAFDMDAELKAVSAFVWRGRTLNEDPCIQPSFTVGYGGFSANVWGSWNVTSVSNSWQSSRIDISVDYRYVLGNHIIRPGFTAFMYHVDPQGKADDTYECFVNYTYDTFLLPSVTLYYDLSEIDGLFLTMSVAHSFTLIKDKMAMDLKLQVDGADKKFSNSLFKYPDVETRPEFLQESPSFVDMTAMISLPVTIGKNGILTPALKYIMLLDAITKDVVDANGQDANIFVYSLAYSMTF